jgi:hypothetical protein
MKKVERKSRTGRYETASDWPTWTDDVRFVPTDADAAWASQNLNDGVGHTTENPPDSHYDDDDQQARPDRGCP